LFLRKLYGKKSEKLLNVRLKSACISTFLAAVEAPPALYGT
ncbi:39579_t:CDS:1, partial [Gigaspora margarita]